MDVKRIGAFIAQQRKKKGLTQAQLAVKLQISEKAISKWENGRGFPDISLFPVLAEVFEVSLEELVAGEEIPTPLSVIDLKQIQGKVLFEKLNKEQKSYFIKKIIADLAVWVVIAGVFFALIGFLALSALYISNSQRFDKVEFSFYLDAPTDEYQQSVDYFVGDTIVFSAVLVAETTRKNITLKHINSTPFEVSRQSTVGSETSSIEVVQIDAANWQKSKMYSYDENEYPDYRNKMFFKQNVNVGSTVASIYQYTFTPNFRYNNRYYKMESKTVIFNIKERGEDSTSFSLSANCLRGSWFNNGVMTDITHVELENTSGDTLEYFNLINTYANGRYNIACITGEGTMTLKPLEGFMTAVPTSLMNKSNAIIYEQSAAGEKIMLSEWNSARFYSYLPYDLKSGDAVTIRIWTDLWIGGQVQRIYAPDICLILSE